MARLIVKVHASARKTGFTGRMGEAYRLNVAAPPINGKANEACVKFIAALLNIPRARVRIISGFAHRTKVLEIEALTQAELDGRMGSLII
jgi:uncharacterized protein YggU (UPF0235/DUF167 family)